MFQKLLESRENDDDLLYGQVVVIAARWVLVVAGLLLALWAPEAITNPEAAGAMVKLQVQVVLILGLAMANFFLHAQVLMKKPLLTSVAYAASAVDIAVISLIVIVGEGFQSGAFVFYFPAVLAISVAFRTGVAFTLTAAAVLTYGLIGLPAINSGDSSAVLVARMLMLAAVAVCGNVYYRNEAGRRQAAEETRSSLQRMDVQELPAHPQLSR